MQIIHRAGKPTFRTSLRCAIWAGALVALLLIPAAPAAASPARYVFEACDSALPGGGVSGIVYGPHPRGLFSSENTCGQQGGALVLHQAEIAPGDGGDADWAVPIPSPPGGSLESVTITATACGAAEASIYSAEWIRPATDWPTPTCGADVRTFPLIKDFVAFFIQLKCVNGRKPNGEPEDKCHAGPSISAHYFAATAVDPVAPTLDNLGGSMLSQGVKRGRQSIGVDAEDVGGGISSLTVSVNGLPAAAPKVLNCNVANTQNPSVAGTVAAQMTPCPAEAEANWTLDTGTYPFRDGANSVQVCASDFATLSDPNVTCAPSQSVDVDNACSESLVPGGEVLSAQFEGSNAEEVTVGFGESAEISGRLANNAGDPIRGARMCVKMETIGSEERPALVGSTVTDANGRYSYEVPPGPNREIIVGYRHDSVQVVRDVRYYAHARPSLHASSPRAQNGERIRFWGEIPGPKNAGRVVVLQAGSAGSRRWITFSKATTKANGLFRFAHRFNATSQRTRYRFRAVVPTQAGYPWVAGHSKPIEVLVTG
jgi:hypothetical protein